MNKTKEQIADELARKIISMTFGVSRTKEEWKNFNSLYELASQYLDA